MSTPRIVFRAIVFALAGAVLVYLGVGQLLASDWRVDTQRTIAAPPDRVAAVVRDLGTWQSWSLASVNLGPETARRVDGAAGTVGQQIVWEGARGRSMLTLTRVDADGIEYSFQNQLTEAPDAPNVLGGGTVHWRADGAGTQVVWSDHGHWDQLAGRWIGWFGAVQERMKQIQSASLAGLAERLEADGAAVDGKVVPPGAASGR